VQRLQSLEADLKALRDSTEALVAERNQLQQRLAEAEKTLEKARSQEGNPEEEIKEAIAAFESLVERGLIKRPRRPILAEYIRTVTVRLMDLSASVETSEKRIAELEENRKALEEKIASGETALRDALAQMADLQKQIDIRIAESEQRTAELEKALAEAQKTIATLETGDATITELVNENRRLAAQIEAINGDLAVVMTVADEAKAGLEAARVEAETRIRAELTGELERISSERDLLNKQLVTANLQLKDEGKTPILPADQVAVLINDLVGKMQTNLSGLLVREGEVKLKVAFGAVGETGGFVIPTTDSTPEMRENLQEVTFRFDRSAASQARTLDT
jgi:chromosome segregation ATPase